MGSNRQDGRTSGRTGFSRRSFLVGAGGAAAGGLVGQGLAQGTEEGVARSSGTIDLELSVNGESVAVSVEPRTTLLNALRNHLEPAVTGPKLVCDAGTCGACTVLLDRRPVYACMLLALDAVGREVTTVEGLTPDGGLSVVQEAFVEKDASMCGFCTSGFVVSVHACLERNPAASLDEIQHACSGNLCRCGTYPHVFDAARTAGARLRAGGGK
ncbi:MAG TPA: (2Fe-2S)-binding protein [Planctomycetota bacterium]|nr:(2Fe-2S)-binding protein [Planctomycetota bacterium]